MSSPEPESSPQPGAGSDARLQQFREDEIEWCARKDEMDDLATLSSMTKISEQLPAGQLDEIEEIKSRTRIDVMDDLATESDMRNIREQVPASKAPAFENIKTRAIYDERDRLANQHDMTKISEQLTENGVPDADDHQARITARTTAIREQLQAKRDAYEANTAGREADDIDLGHSLWRTGY